MEIERKFFIEKAPEGYESYPYHMIEQAYLCTEPVVRIRREDSDYYLTYKGKGRLPSLGRICRKKIQGIAHFP